MVMSRGLLKTGGLTGGDASAGPERIPALPATARIRMLSNLRCSMAALIGWIWFGRSKKIRGVSHEGEGRETPRRPAGKS